MTIQELRAKKVELAKVIREMADLVNAESRDFTGDEQHKWETVNAERADHGLNRLEYMKKNPSLTTDERSL